MPGSTLNTLKAFQSATGGELAGLCANYSTIKYLLIDSRKLLFASSTCFFALSSPRRNGHDYIEDLYKKGVRNFVVYTEYATNKLSDANFLKVEDVLIALQSISARHRSQFDIPVIGITGSNGKTVVKEWLFTLLQKDFMIVRSPGSYNSQIGVPLSVWQIENNHELGIFEAGISQTGEMDRLSNIIRADTCLFLNIGSAHDAGFSNRRNKVAEKLKLANYANTIIFPSDDDIIYDVIGEELGPQVTRYSWGYDKSRSPYLQVINTATLTDKSCTITAICQQKTIQFEVPFQNKIDIDNVLHCITYMLLQGYDTQVINSRLKRLEPLTMRLELRKGQRDNIIINDTYSNDPESLQAGLSFLAQQAGHRQRVLILSDFRDQVSKDNSQWQESIINMIAQYNISAFYGLGEPMGKVTEFINEKIEARYFSNAEDLHNYIIEANHTNAAFLFKAARFYQLDRWVHSFLSKSHKTILEVNMEALADNFRQLTSNLSPNTGTIIMLKSFAYGSGDIELARFFEEARVSYLATAYLDEAVKLRQSGIQLPIIVLNPDPESLEKLWQYRLEPEIYSLDLLDAIVLRTVPGNQYKIHIKFDTGMNRLGFRPEDMPRLVSRLREVTDIEVASVFTHLVAAEDSRQDNFSQKQLDTFDWMYHELTSHLHYKPKRHALNSAGTIRFPDYHLDFVRLGIGLYGVYTDLLDLKPVHRLKAYVLQIKTIQPGESVGYSRAWIAEQATDIAIISIGYGDGLLRAAGNEKAKVWIRGERYPIIGHICMDLCMVNLSLDHQIMVGDEVIIFGPEHPAMRLAEACQTSVYEIVSRISERVNRSYISY